MNSNLWTKLLINIGLATINFFAAIFGKEPGNAK